MLQRISRLQGVIGARAVAPAVTRSFGFGSHMNDNEPEVIEKAKQKHLKGQTVSHVNYVKGWSETLASDSEAVVKAEGCADCSPEELQQETIRILEEEARIDGADSPETRSGMVEPKSGAISG